MKTSIDKDYDKYQKAKDISLRKIGKFDLSFEEWQNQKNRDDIPLSDKILIVVMLSALLAAIIYIAAFMFFPSAFLLK